LVSKLRIQRIAERIQKELSEILLFETADPRLEGISVTDVQIDRELAYANIYVSAIDGSERSQEIVDALKHASGYLRYELSHRIELRSFPQIRFHWDPTFERAERIERIIASLHEENDQGQEDDQEQGNLSL